MSTRTPRPKARVDPVRAALERLAEAQAGTQAELRELAEAQRRTEQRVEELAEAQRRTEQRVEELAEAQRRTERRVEELAEAQRRTEQRVEELAEAQRRTEQRVEELAEAQRRTEEQVAALAMQMTAMTSRMNRMDGRLGTLAGRSLEQDYREHAHAYFDDLLAGIQVLSPGDVARLLDAAVATGAIAREDRRDAIHADVVLRGRRPADQAEAYLVAEVSASISDVDTTRATRRSGTIARATGLPVVAAVAGERIHPDADRAARAAGLWRVLNDVTLAPSETAPADRLVRDD